MRVLTVLSGILLVLGGGFGFAYSSTAFAGLAFVLGADMLISGVFIAISYLVSGKKFRLPETVFVEGLATALLGFAVLNNQVADTMVIMFFGTWLTVAGTTRISQAFSVSRFNPSDWAKVLPLAAVNTILGVVMMQNLITTVGSITLVAIAFIADGMSQLIYAMYMKPHALTEREKQAIARAEAKEAAAKAKRAQRDELRKLSMAERKSAKEAIKAQRDAETIARKEAVSERRKNRRKTEDIMDSTIQLTPSEEAEIREGVPEELKAEDVRIAQRLKAARIDNEDSSESAAVPADDAAVSDEKAVVNAETDAAANAEASDDKAGDGAVSAAVSERNVSAEALDDKSGDGAAISDSAASAALSDGAAGAAVSNEIADSKTLNDRVKNNSANSTVSNEVFTEEDDALSAARAAWSSLDPFASDQKLGFQFTTSTGGDTVPLAVYKDAELSTVPAVSADFVDGEKQADIEPADEAKTADFADEAKTADFADEAKAALAGKTIADENAETSSDIRPADEAETTVLSDADEGEKPEEQKAAEEAEVSGEPSEIDKIVDMRDYASETQHRPTWHKPIFIPSLRQKISSVKKNEPARKEEPVIDQPVLAAVNIAEIEEKIEKVEFEPVQLPEFELTSKKAEVVDRQAVLDELSKEVEVEPVTADYVPLKLEDLIPERPISSINVDEKKALEERLTSTFHWNL